ncbi:Single-strand DNA-binding [Candidatus Desulfofervidus auxilii]|uniref:Single-stranded DNA-binding protein n=1 Tax=Desulfofervidus auxilii TaxID=1621989 RepID=A0A7U4QIG9_DESA2|nr:single-stranded DNA-binding protein [Candidatus Desulfofervidus auxilii]AMM39977.1 Single-strand DNA-binding [Candidatus Desulfofervidus auxilii]
MAGINKVILIGHLGADPELRYTPNGTPVANFRIATTERWTNKQGERTESTEWHRIVAWGKLGEFCGQYLNKGKQVYIEGRLRTRSWEDRDGKKQWTTEIIAQRLQLLGKPEKPSEEEVPVPEEAPVEEDIPF